MNKHQVLKAASIPYKLLMKASLSKWQLKTIQKVFDKVGGQLKYDGTNWCQFAQRMQNAAYPLEWYYNNYREGVEAHNRLGETIATILETGYRAMKHKNKAIMYF